tara:strand:+ start:6388 stop:6738 length:351 start_codon:yes stop_codon:yes gene_type:complete
MAYIKPNMNVFFANNGKPITAVVEKISFRRYRAMVTDKETGKKKPKMKSMPFACCKVILSSDSSVLVGEQFLIAGYKLQNVVMKNERMLTFKSDYVAEYAKEGHNEWVRRIIDESR